MRSLKSAAAICALAASLCSGPAAAASTFAPATPLPFELVNLRMTVDSCSFSAGGVSVANTGNAIQVRIRNTVQCLVAGTPVEIDVRLGAFPAGVYNVEVASLGGDIVTVQERLQLTVNPRATIAIFPPPPFPLTDYTGLWYDPTQPGWGLSIHQNPSDSLFAALFEYTAGVPGVPTWSTFQSGHWTGASTWEGTAYRTTFPPLVVEAVGTVTIDFDVAPPPDVPAGLKWARVRIRPPSGVGGAVMYVTRQRF